MFPRQDQVAGQDPNQTSCLRAVKRSNMDQSYKENSNVPEGEEKGLSRPEKGEASASEKNNQTMRTKSPEDGEPADGTASTGVDRSRSESIGDTPKQKAPAEETPPPTKEGESQTGGIAAENPFSRKPRLVRTPPFARSNSVGNLPSAGEPATKRRREEDDQSMHCLMVGDKDTLTRKLHKKVLDLSALVRNSPNTKLEIKSMVIDMVGLVQRLERASAKENTGATREEELAFTATPPVAKTDAATQTRPPEEEPSADKPKSGEIEGRQHITLMPGAVLTVKASSGEGRKRKPQRKRSNVPATPAPKEGQGRMPMGIWAQMLKPQMRKQLTIERENRMPKPTRR